MIRGILFVMFAYWFAGIGTIIRLTENCIVSAQEAYYMVIIWPVVRTNGLKCENKK